MNKYLFIFGDIIIYKYESPQLSNFFSLFSELSMKAECYGFFFLFIHLSEIATWREG